MRPPLQETTNPSDGVRATAVGLGAAAIIAVPTLGPLLRGSGEQTGRYDTAITPPGYAFGVWYPIFAGIAAHAVDQARRRSAPEHRRSGWLLAGAYGLNAAWSSRGSWRGSGSPFSPRLSSRDGEGSDRDPQCARTDQDLALPGR